MGLRERLAAVQAGAAGIGGSSVILDCAAITGTDGTYTGIIDVSGGYGGPASANSTGAGSGGGGGVVILSSRAPITTPPATYTAGGPRRPGYSSCSTCYQWFLHDSTKG